MGVSGIAEAGVALENRGTANTAAALAATVSHRTFDQLRLPASQRTWQGEVFGVPYDFRPPTLGRLKSRWWNPDDPRLFTPRAFGVGWDMNIYRLLELALYGKTARVLSGPEAIEPSTEAASWRAPMLD